MEFLRGADVRNPYSAIDEDMINSYFSSPKKLTEPGVKVSYSNLGMGLLALILEKHCKKSYSKMVEENIAIPADMDFRSNYNGADRLVQGYNSHGKTTPQWSFLSLTGAGGLRMTSKDVNKYLRWVLKDDNNQLREAVSSVAITDGKDENMLGWVRRSFQGSEVWWHNGATGGFNSFAAIVPDREIAVSVLINQGLSPWKTFFGKTPLATSLGWEVLAGSL